MSSYKGSLKIAATADVIDAVFEIDDHHLTVSTGGEALGSWPLTELDPDDTGTEVLLALDGERVAVHALDHVGFTAALAPATKRKKSRRTKPRGSRKQARPEQPTLQTKPKKHKPPPSKPKPTRPKVAKSAEPTMPRPSGGWIATLRSLISKDTWNEWLDSGTVQWVVASLAVMIVVALALFATTSLGMILVLLGMVSLIIAALAVSEDLSAYSWIPGNLSEVTLVIVGAAAMVVGGVLILIG